MPATPSAPVKSHEAPLNDHNVVSLCATTSRATNQSDEGDDIRSNESNVVSSSPLPDQSGGRSDARYEEPDVKPSPAINQSGKKPQSLQQV